MLPIVLRAAALLALVVVVGVLIDQASPQPASLATDVGLQEQDVCTTLASAGAQAVARLNATGFPHPTTSSVEYYRLTRAGAEGGTEAQIRIDWSNQMASCLPAAYGGPVDVDLVMKPHAYDALVGELQHVLHTGHASLLLPANWITITWGTHVEIHQNPAYEGPYKARLASWAGGAAIRGRLA